MKFSIVMPSFNQADFIRLSLESILKQKGDFRIEVFVMDGKSTDHTVDVLKEINKAIQDGKYLKYNQGIEFHWESQKDDGQTDAINKGMKKVNGDIVSFLNSDDIYEEGTFLKVADAFTKNKDATWLTGYCHIIDERGNRIQRWITLYKNLWLRMYSYNLLLVLNFICQQATFWRSEALKDMGFFETKLIYVMDYNYWLRLGKKYGKPIVMKEYLALFRIHSNSKGKTQFVKQFDEELEVTRINTNKRLMIFLHGLHNGLIKAVYKVIK